MVGRIFVIPNTKILLRRQALSLFITSAQPSQSITFFNYYKEINQILQL